jgi:hypothetical protein
MTKLIDVDAIKDVKKPLSHSTWLEFSFLLATYG